MKSIDIFKEITRVPRPSGKEQKIRDFLIKKADGAGYPHKVDQAGNLLVSVPASGAYAFRPTVVLQSHMDMVCEKNPDVTINFETDPIETYEEDGFLKAKGTTLGADNGVGMALSLYAAGLTNRPPLELIFTVDEESGMGGARGLKAGFLTGSRLINLDSDGEGTFTVGCAGGAISHFNVKITRDAGFSTAHALSIKIDGLEGGHSGVDIHLGRVSAVKALGEAFAAWTKAGLNFRICHIDAGNAHNAIARLAEACVYFADEASAAQALSLSLPSLVQEKNAKLTIKPVECADAPYSKASGDAVIGLMNAIPFGPLAMSSQYEGCVETSNNLAYVKEQGDLVNLCVFYRSFLPAKVEAVANQMAALAKKYSAEIVLGDPNPSWPPAAKNALLDIAMERFEKMFGKKPAVGPVHAGLECGYFIEVYPHMEAISFGPNNYDLHSPTERLEIASLERTEAFLTDLLGAL